MIHFILSLILLASIGDAYVQCKQQSTGGSGRKLSKPLENEEMLLKLARDYISTHRPGWIAYTLGRWKVAEEADDYRVILMKSPDSDAVPDGGIVVIIGKKSLAVELCYHD